LIGFARAGIGGVARVSFPVDPATQSDTVFRQISADDDGDLAYELVIPEPPATMLMMAGSAWMLVARLGNPKGCRN